MIWLNSLIDVRAPNIWWAHLTSGTRKSPLLILPFMVAGQKSVFTQVSNEGSERMPGRIPLLQFILPQTIDENYGCNAMPTYHHDKLHVSLTMLLGRRKQQRRGFFINSYLENCCDKAAPLLAGSESRAEKLFFG